MSYPKIDGEIPDSLMTLINYGVERLFEGLKMDMKEYPGGIEQAAADLGVKKNTTYCLANPRHASSMNLSTVVNFLAISPATNLKGAFIEVADVFARYRENEAKRKLEKYKSQIGALK